MRRKRSTVFGDIHCHRIGYRAPGKTATEASKAAFDECVNSIDRATGSHLPKRQCEAIVAQTTQDFKAFYDATTEIGENRSLMTYW